MLTTSSSEAGQRVTGSVIALALGKSSDGSTHGLVGHGDEANGHLLPGQPLALIKLVNLLSKLVESLQCSLLIKRLVLRRSEYLGEILGEDATKTEISVSDS